MNQKKEFLVEERRKLFLVGGSSVLIFLDFLRKATCRKKFFDGESCKNAATEACTTNTLAFLEVELQRFRCLKGILVDSRSNLLNLVRKKTCS